MASTPAAPRRAPPFMDPPGCAPRQPEATLLYQLIEQHYPAFLAAREAAGRPLPTYVIETNRPAMGFGLPRQLTKLAIEIEGFNHRRVINTSARIGVVAKSTTTFSHNTIVRVYEPRYLFEPARESVVDFRMAVSS